MSSSSYSTIQGRHPIELDMVSQAEEGVSHYTLVMYVSFETRRWSRGVNQARAKV